VFEQMVQDRDNDERESLAALLRSCASVAEKFRLIDRVKKQAVCRLSGAEKPLPHERAVRQNDFAFGEPPQVFWLLFFGHA